MFLWFSLNADCTWLRLRKDHGLVRIMRSTNPQFFPELNHSTKPHARLFVHPPLPAALTSLFPHSMTSWCWNNFRFQLLKPLWDFKTIKPQTEVYDPESHCCFLKAACEKGTYSKNNDLLAGILQLRCDKTNRCEKWRWHFEIKTSGFCDFVKQRFKQTPSDSDCRGKKIHKLRFLFSRKPTKRPPCTWAASLLRLDDESMCHHGDADEGWCHHDLTAVLSAGSMDAIRIHQPGCSVTFQPVGTLWKNAAAAVEPQPNKHNLFEKGKVRGKHPLGVPEPTHFISPKIEKIHSVETSLRNCRFFLIS